MVVVDGRVQLDTAIGVPLSLGYPSVVTGSVASIDGLKEGPDYAVDEAAGTVTLTDRVRIPIASFAFRVDVPAPVTYTDAAVVVDRVTTVGTAPAELLRATLRPLTAYRARVELFGVDRGNGHVRDIEAHVAAKRLAAGAVLVPNAAAGGATVLADHRDGAAGTWTIVPSVDGADFVITVTGAAGRTVDWFVRVSVDAFTPGGR